MIGKGRGGEEERRTGDKHRGDISNLTINTDTYRMNIGMGGR